ncbi:MAG: hypothetical protein ABI232_07200 [Jatrophihabitantaceae bacterium]
MTCSQITIGEIQPLVDGTPQAPTITAEGQDGAGQQCVFRVSNPDEEDGRTVDILVESGSLATDGYAQELASATGPVMLTGIGDKGFRETGDDQVTALKGDTYCSVTLGSGDTIKGVGPIESAHGGTSDIGEANNAIVAAALGTLCNRIYGSGNTTPDLSGLS